MSNNDFSENLQKMRKIAKTLSYFTNEEIQRNAFQFFLENYFTTDKHLISNNTLDISAKTVQPKIEKRRKIALPDDSSLSFNATSFINELKESKEWKIIEEKIFHNGSHWDRIQYVLLKLDQYSSSGEILKIYDELALKGQSGTIATEIKRHLKSSLIKDTSRKGYYKLSAPAKREAEKWLNDIIS